MTRRSRTERVARTVGVFLAVLASGGLVIALGAASPETADWTIPLGGGSMVVLFVLVACYAAMQVWKGEV